MIILWFIIKRKINDYIMISLLKEKNDYIMISLLKEK